MKWVAHIKQEKEIRKTNQKMEKWEEDKDEAKEGQSSLSRRPVLLG